jgi:hypothetical protein
MGSARDAVLLQLFFLRNHHLLASFYLALQQTEGLLQLLDSFTDLNPLSKQDVLPGLYGFVPQLEEAHIRDRHVASSCRV